MKPGNSNQLISRKKSKKNAAKETRNWLDLPREIWIHIFIKLGTFYVLYTAQNVCSLWREISKEPQIFRCVEIPNFWHLIPGKTDFFAKYAKITKEALNRCNTGELVKFSIVYFGTDELLELAVAKSRSSLRSLRIANCYYLSEQSFMEIVAVNPMLEEIDLPLCCFKSDAIGKVGRLCQHLKSFSLTDNRGHVDESLFWYVNLNEEAYTIANNMPGLRYLDLFGNKMDNKGLQAILDKCPHLEYLDLRRCFRIDLEGDLMKKCEKIQKIRLPYDPADDYEFQVDDDYGHPSDMHILHWLVKECFVLDR